MGEVNTIFSVFILFFVLGIVVKVIFLFGSSKFAGSANLSIITNVFVKGLSNIVSIG